MIPDTMRGEQYADDVALIFKPEKILYSSKTSYQKIDIIQTKTFGKILFLDGLLMKTDKDGHIINEMIVHPVMRTGRPKKHVLVIGGGEGFTATELLKYPEIETIDVIDIDKAFVDVCRSYYPDKTLCFQDRRVNLHHVDGHEYLKASTKRYDAIFITPTDPLGLSDTLFTGHFYQSCFDLLVEDGILQTDSYMPFYQIGTVDYASIYHDLKKNISYC